MTIEEIVFGLVIGIVLLFSLVSIAVFLITREHAKRVNGIQNVYLKKLENSDCPIKNAMNYLVLTNGIEQFMNGAGK